MFPFLLSALVVSVGLLLTYKPQLLAQVDGGARQMARPVSGVIVDTLRLKIVRLWGLFVFLLMFGILIAHGQSIDFDATELFTQINAFIPVGIAIFAVPVGILVAFTLVRFVANALLRAFSGKEL